MFSKFIAATALACVGTGLAGLAQAHADDLDTAYKRELSFLDAELSTLKKRTAELDAERAKKEQAARAELDKLQGRATSLSLEADKFQQQLSDAEDDSTVQTEAADVLQSTLQQAEMALSKGGFKLPEVPADATAEQRLEQLDFAFDKSIELLRRNSSVHREPGEFFAPDGSKVQGDIIWLGKIGAYGVSDKVAGALAPAGEERLKIWPAGDSSASARAVDAGKSTASLNLFLFESLEKEIERRKEKTFNDVMKAGGPIGWVIVLIGCGAALMGLGRALILARAASNTTDLLTDLTPLVKQRNLRAALARAKDAKNSVGRVLEVTLQGLHRPREQLEDLVSEAVMREQPSIDRFSTAITVAAAVGPLLGLLGTVTGMIATFDVITEFGNSNPKLLAGGISEALVTTELGLLVAIPALLIGNLLGAWGQGIKDDIDAAALRVINMYTGNDVEAMEAEVDALPDLAAPSLAVE